MTPTRTASGLLLAFPARAARRACRVFTLGAVFLPLSAPAQILISTGAASGLRLYAPSAVDWWLQPFNNQLTLSANGATSAPFLTVLSNGSVGVATTNPAQALDVNGSAQFGSGVSKSTFSTGGALTLASGAALTLSGGAGNITAASSVTAGAFIGDGSHLTGIPSSGSISGYYLPLAGGTLTGPLTVSGSSVSVRSNAASSPLIVSTTAAAGSAGLYIDGSNNAAFGTTSLVGGARVEIDDYTNSIPGQLILRQNNGAGGIGIGFYSNASYGGYNWLFGYNENIGSTFELTASTGIGVHSWSATPTLAFTPNKLCVNCANPAALATSGFSVGSSTFVVTNTQVSLFGSTMTVNSSGEVDIGTGSPGFYTFYNARNSGPGSQYGAFGNAYYATLPSTDAGAWNYLNGMDNTLTVTGGNASAAGTPYFPAGIFNTFNYSAANPVNGPSGIYNALYINSGAGPLGVSAMGIRNAVYMYSGGATSGLIGAYSLVNNGVADNLTSIIGVQSDVLNGEVTGSSVAAVYGMYSDIWNYTGDLITNAYFFYAANLLGYGGVTTNAYGLYIEGLAGSGVIHPYGVYQSGASDTNYFAGSVGLKTNAPSYPLDVNGAVRVQTSSLTLTAMAAAPPVSAAGAGAIYFDTNLHEFMVSQNAGPYLPLGGQTGGGWTEGSGKVQLSTPTDRVGVGGSPGTGIKFDVTGNINTSTTYEIGGSTVVSFAGNANNSNIAVGVNAGTSTTSAFNAFVGYNAGTTNTSGSGNTFVGPLSGQNNSTGANDSFLGYQSGMANTTGSGNTFLGSNAGLADTTAGLNTFVGNAAGQADTTGGANTFMGYSAGFTMTTGTANAFFGYLAGYYNTGTSNTMLGNSAGQNSIGGTSNSFVGYLAGAQTNGSNDVFVGGQAGYGNTGGAQNTFLGQETGYVNSTGSYNTFLGWAAGYNNNASNNTFVGSQAGNNNAGGSGNVFLGYQAGFGETGSNKLYIADNSGTPLIYGNFSAGSVGLGTITPYSKLDVSGGEAVGAYAGVSTAPANGLIVSGSVGIGTSNPDTTFQVANYLDLANSSTLLGYTAGAHSTGSSNVFIGDYAGTTNVGGIRNVAVGYDAAQYGDWAAGGGYSVIIGPYAGQGTTGAHMTGSNNDFIGYGAGSLNGAGYSNNYLGSSAGQNLVGGADNTLLGDSAGSRLVSGSYNSMVGDQAGAFIATGSYNTFMGYLAGSGYNNTPAANNDTIVGAYSGYFGTIGSNNVFYGAYAGESSTASSATLIGYNAAPNSTGGGNVVLGYNSGTSITSGSNNIEIGYSADALGNSSNALNIGNLLFATGLTATGGTLSTGDVGIGTVNPSDRLHVVGTAGGGVMLGGDFSNIGKIVGYTGSSYNNLDFRAGAATQLFLNTNGNVGVGTTNPGATLEVNGTIKLSGASPTYKVTNVLDPTSSSDAATKNYVDTQSGLSTVLASTSPAGSSSITFSSLSAGYRYKINYHFKKATRADLQLRFNSDSGSNYDWEDNCESYGGATSNAAQSSSLAYIDDTAHNVADGDWVTGTLEFEVFSDSTGRASWYGQNSSGSGAGGGLPWTCANGGVYSGSSAVTSINIFLSAGTWTGKFLMTQQTWFH